MINPECPKSETHSSYLVEDDTPKYITRRKVTGPHYAALCCGICNAFIQWVNEQQADEVNDDQSRPLVSNARELKCPLTLNHEDGPLTCIKQNCGWWDKDGVQCSVVSFTQLLAEIESRSLSNAP